MNVCLCSYRNRSTDCQRLTVASVRSCVSSPCVFSNPVPAGRAHHMLSSHYAVRMHARQLYLHRVLHGPSQAYAIPIPFARTSLTLLLPARLLPSPSVSQLSLGHAQRPAAAPGDEFRRHVHPALDDVCRRRTHGVLEPLHGSTWSSQPWHPCDPRRHGACRFRHIAGFVASAWQLMILSGVHFSTRR